MHEVHQDSSRSGTEGHTEGSGGVILHESSGIEPVNYFNHNIVRNHDHITELLNGMAEFANFSLSLTTILSDSDVVWYEEMKKSNICYDVWRLRDWHKGVDTAPFLPYTYKVNHRTMIDFRSQALEIAEDLDATEAMLLCCLKYMSQDDVEDMLKINGWVEPPEFEDWLKEWVCLKVTQ